MRCGTSRNFCGLPSHFLMMLCLIDNVFPDIDMLSLDVSPFQGLLVGRRRPPGRRCALPWAVLLGPFRAG